VKATQSKNIIELRQLLAERFPGVRMEAGRRESFVPRWPTGIEQVDFHLEGGLAKSAITEVISSGSRSGSGLLLSQVIRRAHFNGEWLALIDSVDSFDPAALHNHELSRLLWVRCSNAKQAMKAADLLLHDGTIPIVILDLVICPKPQLRRVPSNTWHRLARTVEKSATVCLILTPEPMITTAHTRLLLAPRFTLDSIDEDRTRLLAQIVTTISSEQTTIVRRKASAS
jgi:hypothetical protein